MDAVYSKVNTVQYIGKMGRRSDHSRAELRNLIVEEGHRHMREVGFARFSAREVAKRIGYSIGTLYNVFGSWDHLILAINGRTLDLWRHMLEARLAAATGDPIRAAVSAYFDFAIENRNVWMAIYDFRLPDDMAPPEPFQQQVRAIMEVIVRLLHQSLPPDRAGQASDLVPSLLAVVHGHCFFALNGTFDTLGETNALERCLHQIDAALGRTSDPPHG